MKLGNYLVTRILLMLLSGVPGALLAAPKPLMVHYMPWFESQPVSGHWGWHWTMNHFNPDRLNPTNGQCEIASQFYPLIGPYDSADQAVLEYHVLLMKLAGIDGAIVDWYGMDNYNDYAVNNRRTLAFSNYTRRAGLKFSICYEDATIQQEVHGGFVAAAEAVAHARQTLLYAQSNFFNDPSYLRWKSRPVLLDFGPQYFHDDAAWASNFSVLSGSNQPAFFTEDNRLPRTGAGAFDWPPMAMSTAQSPSSAGLVLSDAALSHYLDDFSQKAAEWPAFVSSAFPRFQDIYGQAGVQPSFGLLGDRNGATLQETMARALTNASIFVQLVTWNDFGEGTVIEPTVEYGYRDLAVIQDFRRQYLDPSFPFTTNDLSLPLRLYNLRKHFGTANAALSAAMDRIFANIVSGELAEARMELAWLESNVSGLDSASAAKNQLQLAAGYLSSPATFEVQNQTNALLGTNASYLSDRPPVR
jgi:hypothetical protein